MNWKQTLFIGGALLVLAACSQATAPQPQLTQVNHRAAAKSKDQPKAPDANANDAPGSGDCRSGYSVSSGKSDCQQ